MKASSKLWRPAVALLYAAFIPVLAVAADGLRLGYMLDISRDKVPTYATLETIANVVSSLGYDQLQLYTEHTFAYRRHRSVWKDASPVSAEEMVRLDAHCRKIGLELVPNQNSFGHLDRWFRKPEYNHLAEAPNGGVWIPWDKCRTTYPSALCPTDPHSIEFLRGLYDELLPNFSSGFFNVGCDEVMDFRDPDGPGRSAAAVREKGAGRVYLDFLLQIHSLCVERGKRMMFWGDIITRHPDLVPELPKDVVVMVWHYEYDDTFAKRCEPFAKSGLDFWVCPGTSGWCSLLGCYAKARGNIDQAVAAARNYGAKGVLLTDWGDLGHSQSWASALPAIAYAAQRVKGLSTTDESVIARIDSIVGARCGAALVDLANLYRLVEKKAGYGTRLFKAAKRQAKLSKEELDAVVADYGAAIAKANLLDAPEWVRNAFDTAALYVRMLKGEGSREADIADYRRLWLALNREGGLEDSVGKMFPPNGE